MMSEVTPNNDDRKIEWEKLMGDDLILHRLVTQQQNTKSSKEQNAEIGDAVYIRYRAGVLQPLNADQKLSDIPLTELKDTDEGKKRDGSIFEYSENSLIVLGEGDLIPALEMGVRFIPKHSVTNNDNVKNFGGIIRAHFKYAHGFNGYDRTADNNRSTSAKTAPPSFVKLPANSHVELYIEILDIVSQSDEKFHSFEFQLEKGLAKKQLGNQYFKYEKNLPKALKLYQSSVALLNTLVIAIQEKMAESETDKKKEVASSEDDNHIGNSPLGQEESESLKKLITTKTKAIEVIVDSLNNASLIQFKQKKYNQAKQTCAQILQQYDPNNMKALIRAAKSSMLDLKVEKEDKAVIGDDPYFEAGVAIDTAMKVLEEMKKNGDSNNCVGDVVEKEEKEIKKWEAEVQKVSQEWKKRKSEYKKKEKEMYVRMMNNGKSNSNNEKKTKTKTSKQMSSEPKNKKEAVKDKEKGRLEKKQNTNESNPSNTVVDISRTSRTTNTNTSSNDTNNITSTVEVEIGSNDDNRSSNNSDNNQNQSNHNNDHQMLKVADESSPWIYSAPVEIGIIMLFILLLAIALRIAPFLSEKYLLEEL